MLSKINCKSLTKLTLSWVLVIGVFLGLFPGLNLGTVQANAAGASFTNQNVEITLTVADGQSGLREIIPVPGASIPVTGPSAVKKYTATANGTYSFTVYDQVGNSASTTVVVDTIDRKPPETVITNPVTGWINAVSATLTVTATDTADSLNKASGVKSITNHYGVVTNSNTTTFTITGNGTYTATSVDNATNVSAVASVTFPWFDRTKPKVTGLSLSETSSGITGIMRAFGMSPDISTNKQVKPVVTATDIPTGTEGQSGPKTVAFRVLNKDGTIAQDWVEYPYSQSQGPNIDLNVDGYVEAKVLDNAGNWSDIVSTNALLDGTPPAVNESRNNWNTTNNPVVVTLTSTDDANGSGADGFWIPEEGIRINQNTITWTFTKNGTKEFQAIDKVGNINYYQVTIGNIKEGKPTMLELTLQRLDDTFLGKLLNLVGAGYNTSVRATAKATDSGQITWWYALTDTPEEPTAGEWLAHSTVTGTGQRTLTMDFENEINKWLWVKITDDSDGVSEAKSIWLSVDKTPVVVDWEIKKLDEDNPYAPVVIHVDADDLASGDAGASGWYGMINPDGEFTSEKKLDWTVYENGTFTFKGYDYANNETVVTVTVDNITPMYVELWEGNQPVIDTMLTATGKTRLSDITYADIWALKHLDLSSKGVRSIPEFLKYARNVEHLDLKSNKLDTVPSWVFEHKKLQSLNLSNNQITSLEFGSGPGQYKWGAFSLEEVDLNLNYLVDWDNSQLKSLMLENSGVAKITDVGNFITVPGIKANQYGVFFEKVGTRKEYIGNTATFRTAWFYNDSPIEENIEAHRRMLYDRFYTKYDLYQGLAYGWDINSGRITGATADMLSVFCNDTGVVQPRLILGPAEWSGSKRVDWNDILPEPLPENNSGLNEDDDTDPPAEPGGE